MDFARINAALQDLIIRLQDAEKGFREVAKAVVVPALKEQLEGYAAERHQMHKALESYMTLLGGDAEVRTSLLGDLHRIFIDIKINSTSVKYELDAVIEEVERGATTLVSDYDQVLNEVELPTNIVNTLISQRATIQAELDTLRAKREKHNAVEA